MATVNALITSPARELFGTLTLPANGGSTATITNTTGKYQLVTVSAGKKTDPFSAPVMNITANLNSGGGATAESFTIVNCYGNGDTVSGSATFVLAPNQGFNISCSSGGVAGSAYYSTRSLSPSF